MGGVSVGSKLARLTLKVLSEDHFSTMWDLVVVVPVKMAVESFSFFVVVILVDSVGRALVLWL